MTICIAGKNRIALEGAAMVQRLFPHHRLVACCNRNDDGVNGWQPSFAFWCRQNGIPVVTLEELYEVEDLVFFSLEFDRIIRPAKFKAGTRLINIHFSKLPAYKGMFTSVMPLLNGERESGVTLHHIDAGIDTGAIIDQQVFELPVTLTARGLYELYLNNGIALFGKNLAAMVEGNYSTRPQPFEGSTYYSKAALDFANVRIDTNTTAFQLHNQVRAFVFREYQLPLVEGERIYRSEIVPEPTAGKPGTVAGRDKWSFTLNTIDYRVRLFVDQEEVLFAAAAAGDIAAFETIEAGGFPVDIRNRKGWNALIVACYHDRLEFVEYLLARGWDLNTANYKGTTAMMYAMSAARERGLDRVLRRYAPEADLRRPDDSGKDIFTWADEYGDATMIGFLSPLK